MKSHVKFFLILYFILSNCLVYSQAEEAISEDNLKSVFIYNFTKLIIWPDNESFETFNIYVIGNSPIIEPLQEIANKRTVNNKNIIAKHIQNVKDISNCHILFISETDDTKLKDILRDIKNMNVLTISSTTGYAKKGVAINFIQREGKMRFEINVDALNECGVEVNSQLLGIAILVKNA